MNALKKLAVDGGSKVINKEFKKYNSIGQEEIDAVNKVMKSGVLSKFMERGFLWWAKGIGI